MARELATSESSVRVGEASGGGVSAGQGITARVVPPSPGVGQLVKQFQAHSLLRRLALHNGEQEQPGLAGTSRKAREISRRWHRRSQGRGRVARAAAGLLWSQRRVLEHVGPKTT